MVARGVMTEDESGFGGGLDAEALGVYGDAAIVGDLDDGAFAPDKGPPRTAGDGTQDGAFFFLGGVPGSELLTRGIRVGRSCYHHGPRPA